MCFDGRLLLLACNLLSLVGDGLELPSGFERFVGSLVFFAGGFGFTDHGFLELGRLVTRLLRFIASGLGGGAAWRVLVRFGSHGSDAASRLDIPGTSTAENALEYAIAEAIIRAQGGRFTLDTGDGGETVLLLDIPT